MAIEAERLVLRKNENAAQIGVDAIGKRDVNDAVESAEGHGRFGAIARQRPQTFALTAGEKDSDGVAHIGHGLTPGRLYERLNSNSIREAEYKSPTALQTGGKQRGLRTRM